MKNKFYILLNIFLLASLSAMSQSVYMHEAQQDAEETGEFSLGGLVILLLIIGIIWMIRTYIKDKKETKEFESKKALEIASKKEILRNSSLKLLNNDRNISNFQQDEAWLRGFVEAAYDKKYGSIKTLNDDLNSLKNKYYHLKLTNALYNNSQNQINNILEKIGYLERISYENIQALQLEDNKKKEERAQKQTILEQATKIVESDYFTLTNLGKTLVKVKGSGFLNIPEGVEIIKKDAFKDAKGVTGIKLPESLIEIESFGLSDCKVESLIIPKNVKKIGENAFFLCDKLKEVIFNNMMSTLPRGVFSTCHELTKVQLPASLISIPPEAFDDCWILGEIVIPETVKIIGDNAFGGCQELKSIKLPPNLEELGRHTFHGCYQLEKIEIPEMVKGIPEYCFYDCGLKQVILKDGLYCIMKDSFGNCDGVKIKIPYTVSYVEDEAFCQCNNMELRVPEGRKEEFESKCIYCYNLNVTEYTPQMVISNDNDTKKNIESFLRLQKAKEDHDRFEESQEWLRQGIQVSTGNPVMDSILFDPPFIDDENF